MQVKNRFKMGRNKTDAEITTNCHKIELSYLLRHGFIQKNEAISKYLTWSNGSKIEITSCNTSEEKYIQLTYKMAS